MVLNAEQALRESIQLAYVPARAQANHIMVYGLGYRDNRRQPMQEIVPGRLEGIDTHVDTGPTVRGQGYLMGLCIAIGMHPGSHQPQGQGETTRQIIIR
jgi:hypothetical protein